jgi:predicted Zn-dependent peptidase
MNGSPDRGWLGGLRAGAAFLSALAFLLLSSGAIAQDLEGRVTRLTLDNGMRFLIMPRGTAPVFSAVLSFRVGSVDDPSGATGMAHLFEHMAFKGTTRIGVRDAEAEAKILDALDGVVRDLRAEMDRDDGGDPERLEALRHEMKGLTERQAELVVKDEFSQILATNGAQGLNAGTGSDLTSYVMSLPANRLELWCLMESARLRDLVVREFYSERDVVQEERRMRVDTQPTGKLYEQLLLTAYQANPYRISVGGWMSDLKRMHRSTALAFRKRYYVPNNAAGALVGNIDPETATMLIRKYFGNLPAGQAPAGPTLLEPPQEGERRVTVEFDAEPELMIAFHKPSMPHPDDTVFDVIDSLLTSGRTSRLFRSLVMEARLASNVSSFEAPGERYPSLFIITAEPRAPHTTAEVEAAIYEELRRLSEELVDEHELQKIRNQVEASFLYALRSNRGLASQLSYFEIMTGDWKALIEYQRALSEVSAEQVRDVAARTFVRSNRTVALLASPSEEAPHVVEESASTSGAR